MADNSGLGRQDWSGRATFLSVLAAGLGFALAGCHSAPQLTPQEAAGKHLYDVRCAHCHEDNDLGLKKAPPDLHGVFQHANLPSGKPATDAGVRLVVLNGKGLMPGFTGRFDDSQMAALLAYLHTGLR
ncbi:MAG: cytochrome c [Terracidiphilus sp.]|jgi:mono/diheme cytochrome c family protein